MPIELFDFDYSASNSLEYINIGQFGDSEITYAPELILWLNSLPNLKEITIPDSDGKINEKMVREAFPLIKVR